MAKKEKSNKIENDKAEPFVKKEFELIRWDFKTKFFVGLCTASFFILVFLKIHGSSIPIWNQVANDGGSLKRGLISGIPQSIRSDEWLVQTPFLLSQIETKFAVENPTLGYGKTTLLMSLPTRHILSYLKPTLTGFYVFDSERGFAWWWNMKIFPFIIASFLLLMLFSKNNFWLSVFGSIWLLLSSSIVWWSINTEIFLFSEAALISLIYLLYSKSKPKIIISAVCFFIFGYSFISILYPAYQVPLVYFDLSLLVGFILITPKEIIFKPNLSIKITSLVVSIVTLISMCLLFYNETSETINVMMNTVYPGKRNEAGGDFPFIRLFTDIFSIYMNETKFPSLWGNICELSSFLMFSPLLLVVFAIQTIISKKTDKLLLAIAVFQLFGFIWIVFGLPNFIAHLTLFHMSPSYRFVYVFGYAGIIFAIIFISRFKPLEIQSKLYFKILSFLSFLIFSVAIAFYLNENAGKYFATNKVIVVGFLFGCANWMLFYSTSNRIIQLTFYFSVLLFVIPNFKIHPISKGLASIYDNQIYKVVRQIVVTDPDAKWVVFGQFTLSNFLKTTGAKVVSGVNYAPKIDILQKLSKSTSDDSIYNRYAHISFYPLINGNDSLKFSLMQSDSYAISMDPCMQKMKALDVKYVVYTYQPQPAEVRCMTLVNNSGILIYRIND